jgi:hypothetical protein
MMRFFASVVCTLLLTSCTGNANNVVLSSLNRSAKIQFLCADLELVTGNLFDLRAILPTGLCTAETIFAPEVKAQFLGAVTQTQTGEVAVVSFTNSLTLDTNRTVPGVTALRVGEQPTGIQISPFEPSYTYVSSFSPKSVQAIPTEAVITGESDFPTQQRRFEAGPTDLALHEHAFFVPITEGGTPGAPVTGAKSTVEYRYLYAAIPELAQIAQIKIGIIKDDQNGDRHGVMGPPTMIDLPTIDCASVELVTPPPSDASDYHRICPEDFAERPGRFIKTVETTTPCVDGAVAGASPVALAIDYGLEDDLTDDILLVADANQPVIHRFSLFVNGARELKPIVTGTPTTDVDVTPFVPKTSDPDDLAATERYLYAVSAMDSSVLVVDYTDPGDLGDPGDPDTEAYPGAVLPTIAGVSSRANEENVESRNRVRSAFANVRSIEVVSPFYELVEDVRAGTATVPEDDICTSSDTEAFALAQNPRNMKGVFLAVSLSNGTMYYLDIYDLNAPCRGGDGTIACTLAETGSDQFASIRRHRRRFGFTPSTFIAIDGTPSLQFNTAPGKLDATTGEPLNSDGPGLEFISCPAAMADERSSMSNVFGERAGPGDEDALICSSSQVWSTFTQRWDARWEGLIPHSEGGLGLFADESFPPPGSPDGTAGTPGNWFLAGDVPFCRVGVLGDLGGAETDSDLSIDHLASYGGDRLLIVGELPPSTRDDPECKDFEDLREDIDRFPVWFPIIDAFNDQLRIGESLSDRYTLDEVRRCFNQFTEYEIHTRNVYTVTGTTSGFIHRVVPEETTGECVFDDDRPVVGGGTDPSLLDVDTFLTARAFEDTQFINPSASFRIGPFPPMTPVTDTTVALLNFNILNQFVPEVLDTSTARRSLPASMLFSEQQDQLFFVDFAAGVRRIVFSPLSIVQTFE